MTRDERLFSNGSGCSYEPHQNTTSKPNSKPVAMIAGDMPPMLAEAAEDDCAPATAAGWCAAARGAGQPAGGVATGREELLPAETAS